MTTPTRQKLKDAREHAETVALPDDGSHTEDAPTAPPLTPDGPDGHNPAGIGPHQQRAMAAALRDHGITTDAAVFAYLSAAVGREISSRKELTTTEAAHIIRDLIDNPPASRAPGGLARALIAVQAELPFVAKNKTAMIPTKSGGSFQYTYADLADVTQAALPLLTKHGLAFSCCPREASKGYELVGVLMHESGETREGALPLYGNDAQALGGSLTYHRRYLLGCMIGLVTDDDADARQAMGSGPTQAQEPPPPAPQVDPDLAEMSTSQLLLEVDRYAVRANQPFDQFTAKWRDRQGLEVSDMDDLAPEVLVPYVQSIRNYVNAQATP